MQLIPKEILFSQYHHLIEKCLVFLNLHHKSEQSVLNEIFLILSKFAINDQGKKLLRDYGTMEFAAQFLKVKVPNECVLRETIERLLSSLINPGSSIQDKKVEKAPTISVVKG